MLGLALMLGLCLAPGLALAPTPAAAQSTGSDSGWRTVTTGMRHFTGLVCPDRISTLSRIRVLTSAPDRIAGCVYQASNGISGVLRSHPAGTSARVAETFRDRFSQAGFEEVRLSGAAEAGISFRTGETDGRTRCETLWRFAAQGADYTLWLVYTLPAQAETIGPLVAAFARHLASTSGK